MHFWSAHLLLACLAVVQALPQKRQGTSVSTNDANCSIGEGRFGPAVAIKSSNSRASSCGCASDIVTGSGFGSSYEECNAIYPTFNTTGYSDSSLRQNACSLDSNGVAACTIICTPNTIQQPDGSCVPAGSSASSSAQSSQVSSMVTSAQSSNSPPSSASSSVAQSSAITSSATGNEQSQASSSTSASSTIPSAITAASTVPTSSGIVAARLSTSLLVVFLVGITSLRVM